MNNNALMGRLINGMPMQQQQSALSMQSSSTPSTFCGLCRFGGGDIAIQPCGCVIHARCIPLRILMHAPPPHSINSNAKTNANLGVQAVQPMQCACPVCQQSLIGSLKLFAMHMHELDRAVELKKQEARRRREQKRKQHMALNGGSSDGGDKLTAAVADAAFEEVQAEASYLLLSHTRNNGNSGAPTSLTSDADTRTGRWTEDEVQYTDFLFAVFEQGRLPIPKGMRLNDFLAEVLLCKASRLTKKMKNMKLSVRMYEFNVAAPSLEVEMLSQLESKFLKSITSEPTRLELSFNLTKAWRSHLSNLCLQIGSSLLDATDWLASLEDMERRAAVAEETIRQARRTRMGLALKTDVRSANDGVFFAGLPVRRPETTTAHSSHSHSVMGPPPPPLMASALLASSSASMPAAIGNANHAAAPSPPVPLRASSHHASFTSDASSLTSDGEANFISNMLDFGRDPFAASRGVLAAHQRLNPHQHLASLPPEDMDFSTVFDNDDEVLFSQITQSIINEHQHDMAGPRQIRNNCGPFLEELVAFMETADLPFQHVDVWVPSFSPAAVGKPDDMRMFHAGHATRSDVEIGLHSQLHEYGEYSTRFSFAPGVGLPGRVYDREQPRWERSIDQADPKFFERAGGAKIYGVQTALGLPLKTCVIGRIVVCFYSTFDLEQDNTVIQRCLEDLARYSPQPKWRLVVEMGDGDSHSATSDALAAPPPAFEVSTSAGSGDRSKGLTHYQHDAKERALSPPPDAVLGMQVAAPSSPGSSTLVDEPAEDLKIAALLGDHMPLNDLPPLGQSSDLGMPSTLVPHFMALRLLLLRDGSRRSNEDNDMLDVIRKSYRGYSRDGRRADKEVAHLLVKDWQFLQSTASAGSAAMSAPVLPPPSRNDYAQDFKPAAAAAAGSKSPSHQCHVMNAPPGLQTYAPTGAPPVMPNTLAYVHPSQVSKLARQSSRGELDADGGRGRASPDTASSSKKRRVSSVDDGSAESPRRGGNIHVVDDSSS